MDAPLQRTIRINKVTIGLIGLDRALNRALADKLPADEAADFIFAAIQEKNYIPPGTEDDYHRALKNEYRRLCGEETGEPPPLSIRILGPGCVSCNKLKTMVIDALSELSLAADVEDIHELDEIWRYGVTLTPALIINNEVKSAGRMPTSSQVRQWLEETRED